MLQINYTPEYYMCPPKLFMTTRKQNPTNIDDYIPILDTLDFILKNSTAINIVNDLNLVLDNIKSNEYNTQIFYNNVTQSLLAHIIDIFDKPSNIIFSDYVTMVYDHFPNCTTPPLLS
jgi:hypothetical protein